MYLVGIANKSADPTCRRPDIAQLNTLHTSCHPLSCIMRTLGYHCHSLNKAYKRSMQQQPRTILRCSWCTASLHPDPGQQCQQHRHCRSSRQ
jgi:hypothetical protein